MNVRIALLHVAAFARRYAKGLLALAGTLAPTTIVGLLALFGVEMDAETVAVILGVLTPITATGAVAAGPANAKPVPPTLS